MSIIGNSHLTGHFVFYLATCILEKKKSELKYQLPLKLVQLAIVVLGQEANESVGVV